jgi:hypothetical protein
MLSTIETHPAGKLLVIFVRKYKGDWLLDCRRGSQTLPKHSKIVAFAELRATEDERRITWVPGWGWALCGHKPHHEEEEQCYCSRIYRLVNSELDNRVEEYDWRDAVRRLVEERFYDEYAHLLEDICPHCDQKDCDGGCDLEDEDEITEDPDPEWGVRPGDPFARQ